MPRKRIAIVGSGCSGLGALWALKNTDHEVHLFEADARLGGRKECQALGQCVPNEGRRQGYPGSRGQLGQIPIGPHPGQFQIIVRDWVTRC